MAGVTYLSRKQWEQLLKPINPARVGRDGKGFSHVEAYEIRAHLNRVFGFGRWSADLTDLGLLFEQAADGEKPRFTVAYRASMRLTVCAPDGTPLATYTEAATGEATNQPSRGDAHDLAIKTAESQAFKRCAVNLGDNFGLSLYAKGSLAPLVKATLLVVNGPAANDPPDPKDEPASIDAHITEQIPPENTPAEDKRETNPAKAETQHRDPTTPDSQPEQTDPPADLLPAFRQQLTGVERPSPMFYAKMQLEATRLKLLKRLVEDRDGNMVTVAAFIQSEQRSRPEAVAS